MQTNKTIFHFSHLQKSIDSFEKASVKLDEEKILMNSSDDEVCYKEKINLKFFHLSHDGFLK